jgi:WD40 repeat protein
MDNMKTLSATEIKWDTMAKAIKKSLLTNPRASSSRAHANNQAITQVGFNGRGDRIVTAAYGDLALWDTTSAQCLMTTRVANADSVRFVINNERNGILCVVNSARMFQFYDLSTLNFSGSCVPFYQLGENSSNIAINPVNNDEFVACEVSAVIYRKGSLKTELENAGQPISYCSYNNSGNYVLTTNHEDFSIKLWNNETGKLYRKFSGHQRHVTCAVFHPTDPDVILSASYDHTLKLWSIETGECTDTLNHPAFCHPGWAKIGPSLMGCTYHPNGKLIVCWVYGRAEIVLWNAINNEFVGVKSTDYAAVTSFVFNHEGSKAVSGDASGFAHLWDFSDCNRIMTEIFPPASSASSVATLRPPSPAAAVGGAAAVAKPREIQHRELAYSGAKLPIGRGGFGIVYRGRFDGQEVAIKELIHSLETSKAKHDFEREARIHATLKHDNIFILYGAILKAPQCLILELLPQSLFQFLHIESEIPLLADKQVSLAKEIAQGLHYLHENGIVHRDLKSSNVLLDRESCAKLCDFGLARVKAETSLAYVGPPQGTVAWMAPELLSSPEVEYTRSSDVYAYAMTLWEIASRQLPFSGRPEQLIITWLKDGTRPKIPDGTPTVLREIIGNAAHGCWVAEPENRLTMTSILQCLQRRGDGALSVIDLITAAFVAQMPVAAAVEDRAADSMPAPHGGHTRT